MAVEIYIHKMSEHMEMARIVRWRVKEGDLIEKFQILMEVETDKAVAELEAPAAGYLKGIRPGAVDGAEVRVGEPIAFIAALDEAVPSLAPLSAEAVKAEEPSPAVHELPPPALDEAEGLRATPVARRVAKELGVDLSLVTGSGPQGRIKDDDVRRYAESQKKVVVPSAPVEAVPQPGEWMELTTVQRLTGQRMLASLQSAPQFALTLQADMTNALWLREAAGESIFAGSEERPSVTAILVKVVAAVLKKHPRANASFEGGKVRLYQQINIGVAVGSESGLVVPVIKDADQKSLLAVSTEIVSYQAKARQMRFSQNDLDGGTFTISNLGMYGIEQFNAILNPPQSVILAVGRVVKTPVGMPDDSIALRPMVSLTLTVDHRVLDGVQGAKFLADIKEGLEKPYFFLRG